MIASKNNIDTGIILSNYILKNRITKSGLGKDINRTGVSIGKYIDNISIQTGILIDICHATKHDFFQDISNLLPNDFSRISRKDSASENEKTSQQLQIEQLQEENKVLKIQNELLMRLQNANLVKNQTSQ